MKQDCNAHWWYDALETLPVVGPLAAMGVDYARGNYNEGGLVANPNVDLPFEMIGGGGGT